MNWYYVASDQQVGPLTDPQFEELVRSGTITPETHVWNEGLTEWKRYGELSPAPVLASAPAQALSLAPSTAGSGSHVCSECGQTFASDEVIRYGGSWVCAGCKPVFIQKLQQGVVQPATLEYASVPTRFAAVFVDGILLWFINVAFIMLIMLPLRHSGVGTPGSETFLVVQSILVLVQLGVGVAYEVWFIGKFGATPGKMVCKVKVVTPHGGTVSFARAAGRYFAKMLSGLILGIGYLMAAFDAEHRALHDRICETRVIKVR